jgi:hypothetical protein
MNRGGREGPILVFVSVLPRLVFALNAPEHLEHLLDRWAHLVVLLQATEGQLGGGASGLVEMCGEGERRCVGRVRGAQVHV